MPKDKMYFDEYQLKELYSLYDMAEGNDGEPQVLDVYELWLFIQKCFPKINFITDAWLLDIKNVFKPFVYLYKKGAYIYDSH